MGKSRVDLAGGIVESGILRLAGIPPQAVSLQLVPFVLDEGIACEDLEQGLLEPHPRSCQAPADSGLGGAKGLRDRAAALTFQDAHPEGLEVDQVTLSLQLAERRLDLGVEDLQFVAGVGAARG